jgi:hypothetical protein
MNGIYIENKPVNQWGDYRPGVVGSVGDVLTGVKLKHSAPDLPLRWERWNTLNPALGSNVQDGYMKSFDSHGRNAKLEDSKWGYSDGFKIQSGWKFQDLREPDKSSEPIMAETAQYSWVNKLVSNYNAQRTGNLFPPPGPYVMQKGDVPRGAGLSVQVLDHVELDYEPPQGYGSRNIGMRTNSTGRGIDKLGYRL